MFCPECMAEYRLGFTRCSDCDVELIDRPVEPERHREPVEIARFVDVRQAEFAVSVLEGSGIEAYIDTPFTGNIAPHYLLGSGGARVLVSAEDEKRAIEVLESSEELPQDELADQKDAP